MEEDFLKWAHSMSNPGVAPVAEIPVNTPGPEDGGMSELDKLYTNANATEDTSEYAYRTADISRRYQANYKGIDNEELYAQNQTSWDKAYNGVVKLSGTAATTFINGTVGLVYGIDQAIKDGKFSSMYKNPLTQSLNNLSNEWEDTYAHYKTQREKDAHWWEPANLFTGNFLWDGIVKNLGFSLGAAASGFAWGAGLKALGLTSKLMSTGAEMAASADKAIAESMLLPQAERLSNINAQLTKLLGAGLMKTDRAIVATFGTVGEAGMEALNNSQEFRKNMIDNFQKTNGYYPTKLDLDQINQYADNVGNWSYGLNSALLSVTNYVQLPKIYASSFKGEKQIVNNIVREGEKYVSALPEKGFGKLLYKTKNVASLFFNTSEAFEEGSQYAIQTGTENYFGKKYKGKEASSLDDGLLYGVKEALTTDEGTLNIFLGGFSGALQSSGVVGVKGYMPTMFQTGKIGERGVTGYGGEEAKLRDEAITAFNGSLIKDKLKDSYLNVNAAEAIQQDRRFAVEQGDILESKDLEFDYAHNFISNRLNYNAKELITEEINSLRQEAITTDGFLKLQQEGYAPATDTKEKFLNRLTNLQEHADHAATLKEAVDIKYKGLVDAKTDKPVFTKAVLDKLVYAGSKVMDYNKRIPQVNAPLLDAGILNTQDIVDQVVGTGNVNADLVIKATAQIDTIIGVDDDFKNDLKTNLRDLVELSLRKKQFIDEYNEIKKKPENFVEETEKEKEAPTVDENGKPIAKPTIILKTKTGDKELEIGTEYIVGRVVKYDNKGNEVIQAPILKIIQDNGDGTIKVLDISNNTIKDVAKGVLESYNLAKFSDIASDKKKNFVYTNRNTLYKHYGIRDINGDPQTGQLEYSPLKDKLIFVYKNASGKVQRKEVWNTLFKAKPGFKDAMIRPVGVLTASEEAATTEFTEAETTISQKLQIRNNIITDLYNNSVDRVKQLNEALEKNKETLARLANNIEDAKKQVTVTKKGTPRKQGVTVIKQAINGLYSLSSNIEKENEKLLEEKSDLESSIPFFKEFLDDLTSLPESGREMVNQLRQDIDSLEELIDVTNTAIKDNASLSNDISGLLEDALSVLFDYVKRLREENPNIPFFLTDFEASIEKYLGEEGAKRFIDEKLGFTNLVVQLESDINDFREELKIPELSNKILKLAEGMKDLQSKIDKVIDNQIAKGKILSAFEEYVEKDKQEKEEAKQLQTNDKLREELIGTHDTSLQSIFGAKDYELLSKKDKFKVVTSTTPIDTGRPHQERANRFGFNFSSLSEKKQSKIKGIIVTSKTEEEAGLEGLTEYLLQGVSEVDREKNNWTPETIIALVMVQDNGDGTFTLVGQDAKPIAPDANPIESAIYQTFPGDKLMANYPDPEIKDKNNYETMFRKDVSLTEQTFLKNEYAKWRAEQLAQDELQKLKPIKVSFGSPELTKKWDDKLQKEVRDTTARIPAQAAGLATVETLLEIPMIEVSTDKSVTNGSVTFSTQLGRVFLKARGGMAKLFNRQFTENEVNTIFDVILQVAKNAAKKGSVKDDPETNVLFNWLRSTVYWGIAKDPDTKKRKPAGYNNIWFEEVTLDGKKTTRLFVSGKADSPSQSFDFTPQGLLNNKPAIVSLIKNLYNHTNITQVNGDGWKNNYYQITGIDEDGQPIIKKWPNYQTYLLSDKAPDESGKLIVDRKLEDIPLTTQLRALTSEEDVNRKNIYFTLNTTVDNFVMPQAPPVVVAEPVVAKTEKEEAAAPAEAPVAPTAPVYVLDGTTDNILPWGTYGPVNFKLDVKRAAELFTKLNPDVSTPEGLGNFVDALLQEGIYTPSLPGETLAKRVEKGDITKEQVPSVIFDAIVKKFMPEIIKESVPVIPPIVDEVIEEPIRKEEAPKPEAPISDKETKSIGVDYIIQNKEVTVDNPKGETATPIIDYGSALKESYEGTKVKVLNTTANTIEAEITYSDGEKFTETFDRTDFENKVFKVEEPKEETAPVVEAPASNAGSFKNRPRSNRPNNAALRALLIKQANKFQGENWTKVEQFLKDKFPTIPVYRVKNVITATNGKQAWGFYENGAIYVYENAEVGTVYHEVFEAVWKMFAGPKEKQKIINEFRNRPGSYQDRFTGETIDYAKATAQQLKEELAEEFRDFMLENKNVAAPTHGKSLISRMFAELLNFIRTFFTGKNARTNTADLFSKIGNGYYKTYNPYESQLSYAKKGIIDINDATPGSSADYRIKSIPAAQVHDIIQQMTYYTLTELTNNNKNLFTINKLNKKELYEKLKVQILAFPGSELDALDYAIDNGETKMDDVATLYNSLGSFYDNINEEWNEIVKQHEEQLKSYSIEFDENDDAILTDEDNSFKGEYQRADRIDNFRKANSAIKLLLGTLAETTTGSNGAVWKPSTIGGVILIPADKVYITLLNELHNSLNVDDMFEKLRLMALGNPNYAALYQRITKNAPTEKVNFYQLEDHDLHLVCAFWKAMKKQNAYVASVFILPSGEIVIGDSVLNTAAKQAKRSILNDMTSKIKEGTSFFNYNAKTGKYSVTDKLKNIELGESLEKYIALLKELNIDFNLSDLQGLSENQLKMFRDAVKGIYKSFVKIGPLLDDKTKLPVRDDAGKPIDYSVITLTPKTLNIDKRLMQLGIIKAIIKDQDFESTYFNINGERSQTYVGPNAISNIYDVLSRLDNINDLKDPKYSAYKYLLTDKFSAGSMLLQQMFNIGPNGTGNRIPGTENLLHPVFVDGVINEETGKKNESSKQTLRQRIITELNLNMSGIYMNLVPGDAAMEHAARLYDEDSPFVTEDEFLNNEFIEIFKNYFISEVNLSRDGRTVVKGKNAKDLRFFKSILGDSVHDRIMAKSNAEDAEVPAEQLYEDYKKEINKAVKEFIDTEAKDTEFLLRNFGIVYEDTTGLVVEDLLFAEGKQLTNESLKTKLKVASVNYIIANIEFHKLIYSDPYQYSDELKRIKSFNSPRQALVHGSIDINAAFNLQYNKGYSKGDIGWTDMTRDHFKSITLGDVYSINDLEGYDEPFEETDGGGYITLKANRVFGIRSGEWTDDNEKQYRHDIEYERIVKSKLSKEEIEKQLKKHEKNNPNVKSTYTARKPIVSGSKDNGRDYNDVVLHKFALVPLSFRILHEMNPDSNAIRLINKMQAEDVDYAVYNSGSKVGTEEVFNMYTSKGEFNTALFETEAQQKDINLRQGISKIPFSIMGVQSEVPSKDVPLVTQGSQVTKLVTMDFLEAGMPIDFLPELEFNDRFAKWILLDTEAEKKKASPLYAEIKNNQLILQERIKEGYKTLLRKLGIKEIVKENGEKGFEISDRDRLINTLKDEILKREVNTNITDAFEGFKNNDVILEATPAYQQIRNILYSIADSNVVRPKISGGMKVQIPSTLFEGTRNEAKLVKNKEGEEVPTYESDILKFYKDENGKRVCELMIGRWFESNKTDEQLLEYFNTTDEGKKILSGLAYRIPTQKQNSIDVFKIAKFLPKDFGDSVVVPSALVKKVGSDFDIDKLSIYLKNIYEDANGDIKLVPFLGYGEEARAKLKELYFSDVDKKIAVTDAKLLKQGELQNLFGDIALGISSDKTIKKYTALFKQWFADDLVDGKLPVHDVEQVFINRIEKLGKKLDKLTNKDLQEILADEYADQWYKQSLENQYIQSLENLVSHPLNFKSLIKPNSADDLKNLTKDINRELGRKEKDYSSAGNMLSRSFMTGLRQAFVSGKYAIGIAAVGQTNHAQNQRSAIYIDFDRLTGDLINSVDKRWLGEDNKINFQEYNSIMIDGKRKPTLSMIKSANNKDNISDIIGQFIDGYVDISKGDWIMELGATPNVIATWLFLIKLGVPIKTVGYFMNQPIVRDYLRSLENNGYSWLFIDKLASDANKLYTPQSDISVTSLPTEKEMYDMLKHNQVGKKSSDMTDLQRAQQQFILKDFFKYAKMAEHLFLVTQGSNFDTATINDPYLVFKKQMQLEKARHTIISSVDNILEESFIGPLKDVIYDVRDAFAEVLLSDKPSVRSVLQKVLLPYIDLNDKEFVKIAQKTVNDLFDWAVQNDTDIRTNIVSILLGTDTQKSAAQQIIDYKDSILGNDAKGIPAKPEHPLFNNIILKSLKQDSGTKTGKVNNLYIDGRDNKVYDQNLTIYGFEELKKVWGDENKDLYTKLVALSVLQSGLTNSPISFTSLLPYEDFKTIYNSTLSTLENMPNLADFHNLHVFERNNWNNSDVAAFKRASMKLVPGLSGFSTLRNLDLILVKPLSKAVDNGNIPKVVGISPYTQEGRSDFIVYSWEKNISKAEKILRRKTGDRSHIQKALMQKVYTENDKGERVPLIQITESNGKPYQKYIYKAINAWGDSYKAQEFYDDNRASVLDNDFMKVEATYDATGKKLTSAEIDDDTIVALVQSATKEAPVATSIQAVSNIYEKSERIITRTEVKNNPKTLYIFGDNDQRKGLGGQAKEMRGEQNTVGVSTKKYPSNNESSFKTDNELEDNKKIITDDINKVIAEWNTGKYNKVNVPQIGVGLAALPTRAPKTYAFLQQELNRLEKTVSQPTQAVNVPIKIDTSKKINIYAGTGENAELSNFANRPFEIKGYKFNSVEQAFQEAKYEFTKRTAEDAQIRTNIQNTASAAAIKKLGSQYSTLDTKAWDSKSSDIMKRVIKLSFEQNPNALNALLATGNAELTHTQDNTKWGKEFPRLLMEVRNELRPTQAVTVLIKSFAINTQVQDENYNVWKIISQEEYDKESKIGGKAGIKARFITNVNPNEYKREGILNPDSTQYIKPDSVIALPENMLAKSTQAITDKNAPEGLPPIDRTNLTCS